MAILPMKMLEENLNKKVTLLLKDNRSLVGILSGYDEYMNMTLDDAEEEGETQRKIGKIIIRGSNVVRITTK
ncbi:MAG: LSM domain-containing protein [Ferroplasma sp.]